MTFFGAPRADGAFLSAAAYAPRARAALQGAGDRGGGVTTGPALPGRGWSRHP